MNRDVCEHFVPTDLPCDKCEQPEALRLADALDQGTYLLSVERDATAAELRRLHAELERCKATCAATSECWRGDADRWTAQRNALLEALKNIVKEFQAHGRQHWPEAVKARAAIKAAEENT